MASDLYVGKRLSFDGQLCTVRYHGEVNGTKGEWLGVEWDDPTRGKHSGDNGGIKYFECASKCPTAGSFVRPTRKSDAPRSFVEALKAKYASDPFEDPDVEIVYVGRNLTRETIKISGKEVEEVGFDKIRKQLANLKELKIVILDGLRMSRPLATLRTRDGSDKTEAWPVDLTDISDACPKAIELDLSRNLFEEWREVASICEQLNKLRSLRADGNRFRDTTVTSAERERCLKAFANIKTLRLEETLLSWEEMANITTLFPILTSFVVASNFYTSLTPHSLAPTITDLNFEDNSFASLSDLVPLTKLPSLKRLVLKSNKISEIHPSSAPFPVFSSTVTEVDLSWNEFTTWAFIDNLALVFPGLTALRISHNPLYQSLQAADGRALTAEDGYMLTLARLGNLTSLNYSPVLPKERLNAESYYLSLIGRELTFAPPHLEAQIIASHPRYAYLCSEYGEPAINRSVNDVNPNSLAARLIRFSFYLGESAKSALSHGNPEDQDDEFEAEIPMSFTAYSLLGVVGKRFGIQPIKCRLVYETGDWMPAPRKDDMVEEGWDSEDSDEEGGKEKSGLKRVMREVEIVPGTRAVSTCIDGMEAIVRVEMK
ncbi:L domain-like protein [Pleomassaria siparia CBS 279.74]|uniref:L domain-like protein n=1 Tax=Pleomassaria siparia CBS 279.74 TaxID=1314801 RepID=A0A6G1K1T0_9PLEO|nr:L domain-like protein [Pleomassaria siparia CBS 279.74]